ncbi:hypothetical protein FB451DRAFT_1186731 [Mycena latifolia]|nr:hypothetical protein FB451DRAFT_1186731 [Mycena latifolia]
MYDKQSANSVQLLLLLFFPFRGCSFSTPPMQIPLPVIFAVLFSLDTFAAPVQNPDVVDEFISSKLTHFNRGLQCECFGDPEFKATETTDRPQSANYLSSLPVLSLAVFPSVIFQVNDRWS